MCRDRDRLLQLLILNEEFLVNASHQLALITSLPFVHTARRTYRLNDSVFVDYFKEDCGKQEQSTPGVDLPFDFYPVFENEGQLSKLQSLVKMKKLVGYFSWIYLTSIISLLISVIGVTMKTM